MRQESTTRDGQSVSPPAPLFARDEGSLREAGQRDLDAALQLLVNRAQYITGASGAAIALRRAGSKDMLCRASAGANAPELGALLSTEFGLSGESVRTKKALRCDDTGQDARVNPAICRELGISSVIVMPVVDDDQVLGVFELFSERANAFADRDLSVVQRLSQMVETAIRLAEAQSLTAPKKARAAAATALGGPSSPAIKDASLPPISSSEAAVAAPVKKPLLWSAPVETEQDSASVPESDQSLIPPVLRDLRKCVACGFPISAGRMLCVECEEKKWRGQLRSQASRSLASRAPVAAAKSNGAAAAPALAKPPIAAGSSVPAVSSVSSPLPSSPLQGSETSSSAEIAPAAAKRSVPMKEPESSSSTAVPEFTLSAGIEPSQSWLAANKYILIVLLAIAAAAGAVFFLR